MLSSRSRLTGGTAATRGGEFHGAWPYDLPPKGHYNYFAASGIILQGAIYLDLFNIFQSLLVLLGVMGGERD